MPKDCCHNVCVSFFTLIVFFFFFVTVFYLIKTVCHNLFPEAVQMKSSFHYEVDDYKTGYIRAEAN